MNEQTYSFEEIPAILPVPELAKFLGIGRASAYNLVRSEQIRALHIGKHIRVPRHALLQYLGAVA